MATGIRLGRAISELWEYHTEVAEEVIEASAYRCLDESLRHHFTALHRIVATLEDEAGN